ncbi:MAG: CHAT domain-containing protein, partial [Salinivirgaceae bacterium]|nr:CHAT domain-containing protein [Salinivirgaceae bacterium]
MNKKHITYISTLIACVVIGVLSYNFFSNIKPERALQQSLNDNNKVTAFIHNQVLSNISYAKTPDKYTHLTKETIAYFLKLQAGIEMIEQNHFQDAWKSWNYCLTNPNFKDYLAEAYLIIGIALGERDGITSFVLLQKALEITREANNKNRILEYCCLNEIIQLLVSYADDDVINQESDKMAKQYSIEAHKMLSDSTFMYWERNASTSIYRIATESLLWLGEDSLATQYIDHLLAQKQKYDQPELAESYAHTLLGVKTYISGNYDESETYFKSAVKIIANATSYLNYDLELPYAYLGSIYIEQKRYAEAIDYMKKSAKTLQKDNYTHIDDPLKQISPNSMSGKESTYNIILCYLRLQYFYNRAINDNVTSLKISEIVEQSKYTNQLIKSWFLNAADEETLLRATKLIKLSNAFVVDLLWLHKDKFDDVVDQVFKLETEASSFYLNYLIELRKHSSEKSNYEKIRELTIELTNAELAQKQLKNVFVQKRLSLLKLKSELWDEEREVLKKLVYNEFIPSDFPKNEAIIKYFMSHANLYVSYYTTNGKGFIQLEKVNFTDKINKFKRGVKSESNSQEELRFFYDLLIKPIEKKLQGITSLTILSDEKLDGITFELLQNSEDEFLINNYAIKYNYSAKNIGSEALPEIENILALAPGFVENNTFLVENITRGIIQTSSFIHKDSMHMFLAPISCSIDEVKNIEKLFETKELNSIIYTANKATKSELIKHLSNQNVIHIATHGISKNEYESGLFFSNTGVDNGFLSLQELYELDIKADLVVLSACKTGVGEVIAGEGIMALPRGFIYAGAKNVIASLWKIHDEKTKDLMVAFYKHLLEDKVSYAEALRLAKLDCIAKGF